MLLNLICSSRHVILMLGWCAVMAEVADQIRKELWQYASERKSLDEFLQWFVPVSCNIEESQDPEAIDIAHYIDGILAEASSAEWDEENIRRELGRPFVADEYGEDSVGLNPFPIPQSSADVTFSAAA